MKKLYQRWITDWENNLAFRSTNRKVRPFEWGLEWTRHWPVTRDFPKNGHQPHEYLIELNERAVAASHEFFAYETPRDFRVEDGILKFTSFVPTPYPENNTVTGQWYPAEFKPGQRKVAVIVLPHWNASAGQHAGLAKGLRAFRISALRMSLPYHDLRMPAELERADYAVSANVARTIDAARQAIIDVRCCIDWLESQGYEQIGIVGTSLGSCYAFLASCHDPRLKINVFNHCSTYFADVVWEGLSTKHIKESLEGVVDLETLRQAWSAISPPSYWPRFGEMKQKKSLFIYAEYDTTFPVHLSRDVAKLAAHYGINHRVVVLPCGHYTLGETPFKYMDGYHIVNFLKRNL